MSYRDMTFCKERTCARFGVDCARAYTEKEEAGAMKWWGVGRE